MSKLQITYTQDVSTGNRAVQYFDFIAQTLDQMIAMRDCDKALLCELIKTHASAKQYELEFTGQEQVSDLPKNSPEATEDIDSPIDGIFELIDRKIPDHHLKPKFLAECKAKLEAHQKRMVLEARIDELKNIVVVMSGIPLSEQGQYLIGDVERRITELKGEQDG